MFLQLTLVAIASFVWIGLRQWQNLNSIAKRYWWMVPTSLLIELAGVYYVVTVARFGDVWWLFLVTGAGGGCGTVVCSWLHNRSKK